MRTPLSVPFAICLFAPALHAGDVHVVDDDGGPGVAFTSIQAAIDAASDGDTILVRDGGYPAFDLFGKGLAIVADTDQTARIEGGIHVLGVPAGSAAVLRGLRTTIATRDGLLIESCAGAVRVEDCELEGQRTPIEFVSDQGPFHGVQVHDSADVWIIRSELLGGQGSNVGFFSEPYPGGSGVQVLSSTALVVDSTLRGGHGASGPFFDWYPGAHGAHGVQLYDSTVWVSGCYAVGGNGGDGYSDYDPLFGTKMCGNGGDGGSGVYVNSFDPEDWSPPPVSSAVTVRDLNAAPGVGGFSECAYFGEDGEDVFEQSGATHTVSIEPALARSTWVSSPVRAGTNARFYAAGEAGDLFLALVGAPSPPLPLPAQDLPLALASFPVVLSLGIVPQDGLVSKAFPVAPKPPGFGAATYHVQGAYLAAGGADLFLAPTGTLTVLEQTF